MNRNALNRQANRIPNDRPFPTRAPKVSIKVTFLPPSMPIQTPTKLRSGEHQQP